MFGHFTTLCMKGLTRSSILISVTGCWICLGVFSALHSVQTFLFLLTFLKTNSMSTWHTNILYKVYTRRYCIGCGPVQIWQQEYHNNFRCFEVLVNFGQVFALFFGAFIVDFDYSLFIVNVIKCYLMAYLCGTPNRRYLYQSCCKTLAWNCAND